MADLQDLGAGLSDGLAEKEQVRGAAMAGPGNHRL